MKRKNKGFSLLEVLIAIIVTTVGILSMVVLQNRAIQYTQEAVNRDDAASLANDLIEIMRAHKDEFFKVTPQNGLTYSELLPSTALYSASGELLANAASCTSQPNTLAARFGCWKRKLDNSLPGIADADVLEQIRVCPSFALDTNNDRPECAADDDYRGSTITVQLAWKVRDNACDLSKTASESSICTYVTRVEL